MKKKEFTSELVRKALGKVPFFQGVIDLGGGRFKIDAPGISVYTNQAGVDMFNDAMRECVQKKLK